MCSGECYSKYWEALTLFGLVTPYGDINVGQHWFRYWLVAWRHQAIIWTNIDLSSVRSNGIHLSAILQEIPQPSLTEISLKITSLNFCSNLPGANEFILSCLQIYPTHLLFPINCTQATWIILVPGALGERRWWDRFTCTKFKSIGPSFNYQHHKYQIFRVSKNESLK